MKINNPRSMVDFTRSSTDELAYKLVTVGQLRTAIDKIIAKFESYLGGGKDATGIGSTGMSSDHNFGYAWLNSEGKVDPGLLPPLAITEVHPVSQTELLSDALKNYSTNEFTNITFNTEVDRLLNVYIKYKQEVEKDNLKFQRGDIILVNPVKNADPNSSDVVNPVYSGSYIITAVPGDTVNKVVTEIFHFAKLAYTDSNIVKINGKVPANSAGELHLFLRDILKERSYELNDSIAEGEAKAQALEDTVYRLVSINEDGKGSYRFGFMYGDGTVVPYAKSEELNALRTQEEMHFNDLSGAIAELDTRTFETFDSMSGTFENKLSTTSSLLTNKTNYISGVIGEEIDLPSRAEGATIFARVAELRNNVDDNLNLLQATRKNTNEYLTLIRDNVVNLHNKLDGQAVKIVEKEITWDAAHTVVTSSKFDESYIPDYQRTQNDVLGILHWTYKYEPVPTNVAGSTENGPNSQERILAIFDADGNEILADMKRIENASTGLIATHITVDTEYLGLNGDNEFVNSLIGQTWKIIVAKTIVNIPNNLAGVTFKVGAAKEGDNNGTNLDEWISNQTPQVTP